MLASLDADDPELQNVGALKLRASLPYLEVQGSYKWAIITVTTNTTAIRGLMTPLIGTLNPKP